MAVETEVLPKQQPPRLKSAAEWWRRSGSRKATTIFRWFRRALSALLLCGLVLGLWAFWLEPSSLVVRPTTLALAHYPPALSGLKIVALSDIHAGSPFITTDKLRQVVARTNAEEPDVIVLLGDYVIQSVPGGRYMPPEVFAPILGGLKARYGVYAVMGNHDWWDDVPHITREFERAGIRVIENTAVELQHHGHPFWLVGIGDYYSRRHNLQTAFSGVPSDATIIACTHAPDIFRLLPPRVNLVLGGHTHGGQVSFPLFGRLVVPSDFGQRYAIGHVEENGHHLFVTPGIGTSILPVRFRVPPEISVLTLVPKPEPAASGLD